MNAADLHHLSAAYALDAVDADERAAFEEHLADCDVCRADVEAFRDTAAGLGASLSASPASSLRDIVLTRIAATRQDAPITGPSVISLDAARRRRRTAWIAGLAGAAAASVAAVIGLATIERGSSSDPFATALATVMEQPDSQVLDLEVQGSAVGDFRVAWSDSLGRAVLIGEDLPPAPDGKAYELWLITPDQSMAMYVLDPADDGDVHVALDAPASPSAWAITVEPEEGTPTATGDIIFVSNVPA